MTHVLCRHVLILALAIGCSSTEHPFSRDTALAISPATSAKALCETVRENGACVLWGPSLVELIARSEVDDGKPVRVIGFVNFEFEGNGLYLSREDWRQSIPRNGLWIGPPTGFESDSAPARRRVNRRYVLVEATFHRDPKGHFGMWSGSLENVKRIDPWGEGHSESPRSRPPMHFQPLH